MYKYPCSQHQRYELDDLYLPKSWLDHLGCVVTTDPRVSLHRRDTGWLKGTAILRLGHSCKQHRYASYSASSYINLWPQPSGMAAATAAQSTTDPQCNCKQRNLPSGQVQGWPNTGGDDYKLMQIQNSLQHHIQS
jgi:hypothetical protein